MNGSLARAVAWAAAAAAAVRLGRSLPPAPSLVGPAAAPGPVAAAVAVRVAWAALVVLALVLVVLSLLDLHRAVADRRREVASRRARRATAVVSPHGRRRPRGATVAWLGVGAVATPSTLAVVAADAAGADTVPASQGAAAGSSAADDGTASRSAAAPGGAPVMRLEPARPQASPAPVMRIGSTAGSTVGTTPVEPAAPGAPTTTIAPALSDLPTAPPTSGPAPAAPTRPDPTMRTAAPAAPDHPSNASVAPLDVHTVGAPGGPTGPLEERVVRSGESFWSIAEDVLTLRRVPADSGNPSEQDIARYWQRLVAVNRDRLVDPDDPDLIFRGQALLLPQP